MSTRFPSPADPYEEAGLASPDPDLTTEHLSGDDQDDIAVPAEHPVVVTDFGMTDLEQSEGEPLAGRLAREQPDVDAAAASAGPADGDAVPELEPTSEPFPEDADERVGRLVAPDEGAHDDEEKDAVATSVGTDLGGFSPEERAMHIDPES